MQAHSVVASIALALAGLLCASSAAHAVNFGSDNVVQWSAKKSESGSKKSVKSRKAKKGKGGVTFHDGSAESRSERDRRLTRECKGRSNSGVCEGYTR